jgi:hypothetical protein
LTSGLLGVVPSRLTPTLVWTCQKKKKKTYLIDTPISNNTHQKNNQKTHIKKLIHLFKYKNICFYELIGLILSHHFIFWFGFKDKKEIPAYG